MASVCLPGWWHSFATFAWWQFPCLALPRHPRQHAPGPLERASCRRARPHTPPCPASPAHHRVSPGQLRPRSWWRGESWPTTPHVGHLPRRALAGAFGVAGYSYVQPMPTTSTTSSSHDAFVHAIARPSDARGRAPCSQDTRVLRSVIQRSIVPGRTRGEKAEDACGEPGEHASGTFAGGRVRRVLSVLGDRGVF